MCRVFAGQDPGSYAFETRSVRLMGHATSVRLENRFWGILEEISEVQGMSMAKFLSTLYEEALDLYGNVSNFASLLRCCCLNFVDENFDVERLRKEAETQVFQSASQTCDHTREPY